MLNTTPTRSHFSVHLDQRYMLGPIKCQVDPLIAYSLDPRVHHTAFLSKSLIYASSLRSEVMHLSMVHHPWGQRSCLHLWFIPEVRGCAFIYGSSLRSEVMYLSMVHPWTQRLCIYLWFIPEVRSHAFVYGSFLRSDVLASSVVHSWGPRSRFHL